MEQTARQNQDRYKVVVAIDSFKGSLSTIEAGNAARDGILRAFPCASVIVSPIADGGEGTVDALTHHCPENRVTVTVTGPLGTPVNATYGILSDKKTAVIEMAAAAGITLVEKEVRDPLVTTTYGVGELIRDATRRGCRRFIIGIGGSATNDGGVGMLSALGFSFLGDDGRQVSFGAKGVGEIRTIDKSGALPLLSECTFHVACDVTNPLCGEKGCSAVYGPQKGATAETVMLMDGYLSRFAHLTREALGCDHENTPGAGAAGGLGFALLSYLGAALESGIGLVLRETGLENEIKAADLVLTGEGRLDGQTAMGKAPVGVAAIAKKYGVPVVALAGCATDDARVLSEYGIDAFFSILKKPVSLAEAMEKETAYKNLRDTAEEVLRLIHAVRKTNKTDEI